jgi:hypothetical protein
MAPNVAFARKMREGDSGRDVIAHKRAVSRAFPELYPWPKKGFSLIYGEVFAGAVKGSCLMMGLKPKKAIDLEYHEHLERRKMRRDKTEWAFDAYSIKLAKDYYDYFNKPDVRQKIIEAGFFWYQHRMSTKYDQKRAFEKRKPPQIATEWDCSAFVTNCYYGGGAPDPNGRNYDGQGYTGTLLSHGKVVPFSQIKPADLIMYGFSRGRPGFAIGAPTHVALYVGGGRVLSLGSYPMGYYEHNYRSDLNCCVTFNI